MSLERHIGPDGKIIAPAIGRAGPVPVVRPLPEIRDMIALTDPELLDVLLQYGVIPTPNELRAGADQLAARMRRVQFVDAESWAARVSDEIAAHTRRTLVGLARRTAERYDTLDAIDGEPDAELIRISEGDESVCENCIALGGAMGSYLDHEAIGLPGAESCLGSDYCRCALVRTA